MPVVSVVMAVYNGEASLSRAINSILQQTLTDFEFIILDDGSTDGTPALLADYARRDARIRIISQPNQGLTASLNRSLGLAQGQYIARMDADDISLPERFARQVALFEAQPDVGVCGTWIRYIGDKTGSEAHFATNPVKIRCAMLFQPPLAHPAVMLRKSVFDAHHLRYNPDYRRAQDYDLWLRAADVTDITNVPEVLLLYHIGAGQVSAQHRRDQLDTTERIYADRFRQMGIEPTPADLETHRMLFTYEFPRTLDQIRRFDAWLRRLHQANRNSRLYPEAEFSLTVAELWYRICRSCAPLGIVCWWQYQTSPLSRHLSFSASFKLLARCLLRRSP